MHFAEPPLAGTRYTFKSVDHAKSAPSCAVYAISFPSGDHEKSSAPPNGFVGQSASTPFIKSIGWVALLVCPLEPTGVTNTWLRFPSFHVSQCRIGNRLNFIAFVGLSAFALSRFAVSAMSA